MEKYKAIPDGYMTVGEVAKKVGITVRTLQYYDNEGILKPSAESEGGRRLYTYKEVVRLHQIVFMKQLGLTLEEIRERMHHVNTPTEISAMLMAQAGALRERIVSITHTLDSIEKLNIEILQTNTINWKKYSDILTLVRADDSNYGLIKHFSPDIYNQIQSFDKKQADGMMVAQNELVERAVSLQAQGLAPESEPAQRLAAEFCNLVRTFTKGDPQLVAQLNQAAKQQSDEQKAKMIYIEQAVDIYITALGYNPFEEER